MPMMNNRIRPGFRPNTMGGGPMVPAKPPMGISPNPVTGGNGATGGPGGGLRRYNVGPGPSGAMADSGATGAPGIAPGHMNRDRRPGLGLGRGNLAARQGAGQAGAGPAGAGAQRRGRGLGRQNMMAALSSFGGMSPYGDGGGMPWGFMSSPGFGGYGGYGGFGGGYGFSPGLPAFSYGAAPNVTGALGNEAGTGATDGVATEGTTASGTPATNPNFGQLMSLLSALGWQQ